MEIKGQTWRQWCQNTILFTFISCCIPSTFFVCVQDPTELHEFCHKTHSCFQKWNVIFNIITSFICFKNTCTDEQLKYDKKIRWVRSERIYQHSPDYCCPDSTCWFCHQQPQRTESLHSPLWKSPNSDGTTSAAILGPCASWEIHCEIHVCEHMHTQRQS